MNPFSKLILITTTSLLMAGCPLTQAQSNKLDAKYESADAQPTPNKKYPKAIDSYSPEKEVENPPRKKSQGYTAPNANNNYMEQYGESIPGEPY